MRIISGKYKGGKLIPPIDDRVRPTTDRIKETIFNILSNKVEIENSFVLDLFAGSGALGIEALSRGAKKCMFIDKDIDSIKVVRTNLNKIKAPQTDYEIFNVSFDFALKKLEGKQFDIIFADPPYALKLESKMMELIVKHNIIADDGVIVIEHDKNNNLIAFDGFDCDRRDMGNTAVCFITKRRD